MQKGPDTDRCCQRSAVETFCKAVPLDILLFPYTNESFVSCLFKKFADILFDACLETVDKACDIVGNIDLLIQERS